jgi:hypothetical protein
MGNCLDTYCMAIWNILRTFGIFYDHLVHFVLVWYIFRFLISCTKKNLAALLSMCTYTGADKENANPSTLCIALSRAKPHFCIDGNRSRSSSARMRCTLCIPIFTTLYIPMWEIYF